MTAAQALTTHINTEWETDIPGRRMAIPDVVDSQESGTGVLIRENMDRVTDKLNTHDVINVQFIDRDIEDTGSESERLVDKVQVDIRLADRDTDGDGIREAASDRVFGTRDENNDPDTLGGVAGELKRILNGIRKGFKEYEYTTHDLSMLEIRNTDVRATYTVNLIIIERNVQQPL